MGIRYQGNSVVKTPKKLKVWKRKLKAMDYCLEELENHGFRYRKTRNAVTDGIWINEKERVVIKQPYHERSSVPAVAAPTIIVPTEDEGYPIVIQVLCETPFTYKEAVDLVDKLERRIRLDTDIHTGNVGRYRNQPVLFDW